MKKELKVIQAGVDQNKTKPNFSLLDFFHCEDLTVTTTRTYRRKKLMIPVIFFMIMELAYLVISILSYIYFDQVFIYTNGSLKIVAFLCFIALEYKQLTNKPWDHPVFIGFCVLLELPIYLMAFPLSYNFPGT